MAAPAVLVVATSANGAAVVIAEVAELLASSGSLVVDVAVAVFAMTSEPGASGATRPPTVITSEAPEGSVGTEHRAVPTDTVHAAPAAAALVNSRVGSAGASVAVTF